MSNTNYNLVLHSKNLAQWKRKLDQFHTIKSLMGDLDSCIICRKNVSSSDELSIFL